MVSSKKKRGKRPQGVAHASYLLWVLHATHNHDNPCHEPSHPPSAPSSLLETLRINFSGQTWRERSPQRRVWVCWRVGWLVGCEIDDIKLLHGHHPIHSYCVEARHGTSMVKRALSPEVRRIPGSHCGVVAPQTKMVGSAASATSPVPGEKRKRRRRRRWCSWRAFDPAPGGALVCD
jgi:hypothetical protein